MNGRTFIGLRRSILLGLVLLGALSLSLAAEPATYFGVTFPQGDLAFADRVVDYLAASCVRDAYDDPEEALGPPDACGDGGCEGCMGCDTNAVSLGFRLSVLDNRGYLVLEFVDNILVDVPGDDLFVYNTNGNPAIVEISSDGYNFIYVGETVGYPGRIDIAPYTSEGEEFHFVRLSDVPADEDHSRCPGPSIDAVGAMGPVRQVVIGETFGSLELQPIGELAFAFEHTASTFFMILDTSSSMGEPIDGSTKIEVAKSVIIDLLDNLPDGALVGMRVFAGCEKSQLVSAVEPLNRQWLANEVRKIEPSGTTPLAYALQKTQEDLAGITDPQLVLLVSDGMETCGGDPVAAAQELVRAGYNLRIHVVGFDVRFSTEAREQLIDIAQSTGGTYFDAQNSDELRQALALAAPFSYTVYDATGNVAYVGRLGEPGPKLAPGTYSVVIDTTPPTTINNVVVQEQETTLITVQQANGGYEAEVE